MDAGRSDKALKKLFVGIDPGDEGREWLGELLRGLRAEVVHQALRWTKPEKVHLTLGFLGMTPEGDIEKVVRHCQSTAGPRFELKTSEVGGFPHLLRPKVIWLGTESSHELDQLRKTLAERLTFDPKPFSPHFTLGRVSPGSPAVGKMVAQAMANRDLCPLTIPVGAFHLYESTATGEYVILESFALDAEDSDSIKLTS